MNLILLGRRGHTAHCLTISAPPVAVAASMVLAMFIAGLALGYTYGHSLDSAVPKEDVLALQQELEAQRQHLTEVEADAAEHLDALALRLGQLNASVIRLNALGRRLTGMANLDNGEFNFSDVPAVGGPEDPVQPVTYGQLPDLLDDLDVLGRQIDDQEQQLAALEGLMLNRKLRERVHPSGRPVRSGYVSSYFGKRTDPFTGKPAFHSGVDFSGKEGSDVIAVAAGVVSWSGDRYGYGNMVEVNHGNGYFTRYAHNKANLVAVGDYVQPGQTIAHMGSTGRATGPNLHFEVWRDGRVVNPASYIRGTH